MRLGPLLAAFATVPALAAGVYQGLPQATPPLTHNELLPTDTGIGASLSREPPPAHAVVQPKAILEELGR